MISEALWAFLMATLVPLSMIAVFVTFNAWRAAKRGRATDARLLVARTNLVQEVLTLCYFLIGGAVAAIVVFEVSGVRPYIGILIVAMGYLVGTMTAIRLWAWFRLIRHV